MPLARVVIPDVRTAEEHVFHLFVIQVENRAKVIEHLTNNDVHTGIHYPVPFYLQGGYRELEYSKGAFPVTEAIAPKILSLPMFPELTSDQIDFVVEKLAEAAG
jgi:dTDP-4-amino-4,6-dideoxygalactose transaminase